PALIALIARGRLAGLARGLLAALLALVIIAGLFDGLLQSVLSRPLNVFLDILMLSAGFHLIDGSMGRPAAVLASVLTALAALALGWLCWRLLDPGTARAQPSIAILAVVAILLCIPWPGPARMGVSSQLVFQIDQQAGELERSLATHRALEAAREAPAFAARALPGLAGRDVYIVLVESYGISALEQPRHGRRLLPVLEHWQDQLKDAGLNMASGQLKAPIRGGQSWLAQATVLSGLMLDNQLFYRRLLDADIDLLTDDFAATGHTTIKVSPAIIMDWPEGEQLGFDALYPADAMDYRGPRLGWATMPDQYTLHHFSERIRPTYPGPVFAQIALVSSHWPWTPLLEPISDWSQIGHGEIYERWADAAESPLALWMNPDRLRHNFAEKIAYSLDVTFDWARLQLPDDALLIVLGDHQPASIITGRAAPAEVPVHVISHDPAALDGFRQRHFADGLMIESEGDAADMAHLRHWLREDFGN
ncbi:MAG: alkaline phosphatase, partial [Wenzhouxiangella sp.]